MILNDLKDVYNSSKCVVKCGAIWCGSCKEQDKIIKENHLDTYMEENNIDYFYLDADEDTNESFIDAYDIKCLPTIVLFKNGEMLKVLKGIQLPTKLKEEMISLAA